MSDAERRPKRKLKAIAATDLAPPPKKWRDDEIEKLLKCLMKNGHKNFEELKDSVPGRNLQNIKLFMRTLYDTSGKLSAGHENLDAWINLCERQCLKETPWKHGLKIAKIIKYLSVDGLIENHPLPNFCSGVNFGEAYRLIYQALLGYPIQPVSEQTAHFVQETLKEIFNEVKNESDALKVIKSHLIEKFQSEEKGLSTNVKSDLKNNKENSKEIKKPLRVYQRKKPKSVLEENPSLKIVVEPTSNKEANSNCLQDFSVTIAGTSDGSLPTVVNVPVLVNPQLKPDEDELELMKSTSFNPLKLPEKWLQEPLYLNILQNP